MLLCVLSMCCVVLCCTDRAKMLGDLGAIIGGALVGIGLIIYHTEKKKREAFSKRIYID